MGLSADGHPHPLPEGLRLDFVLWNTLVGPQLGTVFPPQLVIHKGVFQLQRVRQKSRPGCPPGCWSARPAARSAVARPAPNTSRRTESGCASALTLAQGLQGAHVIGHVGERTYQAAIGHGAGAHLQVPPLFVRRNTRCRHRLVSALSPHSRLAHSLRAGFYQLKAWPKSPRSV